jgi:hypothetical protein
MVSVFNLQIISSANKNVKDRRLQRYPLWHTRCQVWSSLAKKMPAALYAMDEQDVQFATTKRYISMADETDTRRRPHP